MNRVHLQSKDETPVVTTRAASRLRATDAIEASDAPNDHAGSVLPHIIRGRWRRPAVATLIVTILVGVFCNQAPNTNRSHERWVWSAEVPPKAA